MAITIKRNVAEIGPRVTNVNKHFNQMTFKGIILNNNPFDVDQLSFKNAKNVYVDDNGTLISRPPITMEQFPTTYVVIDGQTIVTPPIPVGYTLVDIFETGKIKIFVSQSGANYDIVAMNKDNSELKRLFMVNNYHISAIEQYIIVFNNLSTQVLNINNFDMGWIALHELSEIPVTKRVVGQETFTFPGNQFTESYKEEYVFSEDLLSILPEGTADATINQSPSNLTWTLPDANINTEFRLLRALNITIGETDLVSAATNSTGVTVIGVARTDHVMLSLDLGQSFERILYPSNQGYIQIASVSKDGLYFYFVARDGVYRYSIGDKEWVIIRLGDNEVIDGVGVNNVCCFNNDEVFTFVVHHELLGILTTDIYWKGPNLASTDYPENTLGYTRLTNVVDTATNLNKSNRDSTQISISVRTDVSTNLIASVVAWLPSQSGTTTTFVNILGQLADNRHLYYRTIDKGFGTIDSFQVVLNTPGNEANDFLGVEVIGATAENNQWHKVKLVVGEDVQVGPTLVPYVRFEYLYNITATATEGGAPINLGAAYLVDKTTYSVDGAANLPTEALNKLRLYTVSENGYFYIILDNTIYTNRMLTTSNVLITYTRLSPTPFTQVPSVSHAGSELYLAFDNTLKITSNLRNGVDLTFNLPKINNHGFTSSINALLNISTTEVAIFLINRIYIVTMVADDVFGYRYDYLTTRLSVGIRPGDSVINTMNGMFTLYPTVQGLAVMNYQPDVTNTDQVVEYVSTNINAIWKDFYKVGPIKIVQMNDYIYLSNGSTTYLMLDLRGMSWWVLTSPVPVMKITTDQINFNIISNALYKYNLDYVIYKDLTTRFISWQVESQPNHFNAPSHYKNLRQLIFQLEEATNVNQTIVSQIKLYRKQLTLRDPEIINFAIDSYRTVIKRFNYWKINELQWGLASDEDTAVPAQLKLNGLTIKYEISEEVRS